MRISILLLILLLLSGISSSPGFSLPNPWGEHTAPLTALAMDEDDDDDGDSRKKKGELSPGEYLSALEAFETLEKDEKGFQVSISVSPDLYQCAMAREYKLLKESGYNELELREKLEEKHKSVKSDKGKMCFRVVVEMDKYRKHYFLDRAVNKLVKVTHERKASVEIDDVKPAPAFGKWRIMELGKKKRKNLSLWRLEELEFQMTVRSKAKDPKAPVEIELAGMRCYEEVQKRNEYERIGINVPARQLALNAWSDTEVAGMQFRFLPGKWKLPEPPKELKGILAQLAMD